MSPQDARAQARATPAREKAAVEPRRTERAPETDNGSLVNLSQIAALAAGDSARPDAIRPETLLNLQKRAGNAAVVSLLRPMAARRASLLAQRRAKPVRKSAGGAQRPSTVAQRAPAAGATATAPTTEAPSEKEDLDVSEFTDDPKAAAAKLASMPAPARPVPPPPVLPGPVAKPPVVKKAPAKKVAGPAKKAGPPAKKKAGGPAKKAPAVGEIVKKPAPPLPPRYVPGGKVPPPPAAPKLVPPAQDPSVKKVMMAAKQTVKAAKKHPKGKDESGAALAAAKSPGNEQLALAEVVRTEHMEKKAKPKPFNEEAFVEAVMVEIEKTKPKNFDESGKVEQKAESAKGAIGQQVDTNKKAAAGDVEKESKEEPKLSEGEDRKEQPMPPLEIAKPGGLAASAAMPAPVPNAQIDFRQGPASVDKEMDDAGITEKQLAKSNEPEFIGALEAKKEGEEHAQQAPAEIRKAEGNILKKASAQAAGAEKNAVMGAQSAIGGSTKAIGATKKSTIDTDEAERKKVSDGIDGIFKETQKDVGDILTNLDTTVDDLFTKSEKSIREAFTYDWKVRLQNYKDERYSGFWGPTRWVRDEFRGLPKKAKELFAKSQAMYESMMRKLVKRIAGIVSAELTKATNRIKEGREQVVTYVQGLKGDQAKFGAEAAKEMDERFDQLDSDVKDKFDEMATVVAKKYSESQAAVSEEVKDAWDAEKGLIDKAIDKIKGVYNAIADLKDLFFRVLAKIADVITTILADPIGFIRNFFSAVKDGVERFKDNIETHLKSGLMGWLTGNLGQKGIEIPDSFDVPSMGKLVLSVFGLGWTFIKERLAKKVGEAGMAALDSGVSLVEKLRGGPEALWEMVSEKFTDFGSMVIDKIQDFIKNKIVMAGISFLVSMLNPASAFIKACKMIYDIVVFIIDKGKEIGEFVESIIDAAGDIARGGGGGVPAKIEGVLAKALPLAIGFCASLLNLGGIGDKVRDIIDKVRKPIFNAMERVIDFVVKTTRPIWEPAKRLFERGAKKGKELYAAGKAKVQEGAESVKKKVGAAGSWAKGKAMGGLAAIKGAVGLPKVEKVTMHGAAHTITMDGTQAGVSLVMASAKGDLAAKIAAERDAAVDAGGEPRRIAFIDSIARLANNIRGRGNKAIGAVDPDRAKKAAAKIPSLMSTLAHEIAQYAQLYKIKEFGAGASNVKTKAEELAGPALERLALEAETLGITADRAGKAELVTHAKIIASQARRSKNEEQALQRKHLKDLTQRVTNLRKNLGVEGVAGEDIWTKEVYGEVGEVGKHGDHGGRGRTGRKVLWLESEHVIPRGWLNLFLQEAHNRVISPEMYDRMTTVMLYANAAKLKTNKDGNPSGSGKKDRSKGGDNPVYRELKNVLSGRASGNASKDLAEVRTGLRTLLSTRVDKTLDAVKEDDDKFGEKREKLYKAPRGPAKSQIALAAERQLAEVDAYVKAGGGQSRSGVKLEEVREPFEMGGKKHTLIFTPPAKLEMASERGLLVAKLKQTIGALESADPKPELQIRELRGVLSLAEKTEDAAVAASALGKEALEAEDTPQPVKKLQQLLDALANALDAYGATYHKTDLPREPEGTNVGIPEDSGKTAADLKHTELYKKFGMPARNAQHAVKVAAQFDVTLLVRPTNPTAPVLLERGLLPKPEDIKAKTINGDDVELGEHAGITRDDIGKVGFFEPKLPPQGTRSEDDYRRLYTRYVQRQKEYVDDARTIFKQVKENRLELKQGKLVDKESQKEFTGDHDLYAVLDASGRPMVDVPPETKHREFKATVVNALKSGSFGAQHGAHLDWEPETPQEKRIFEVVVKAHEAGVPLLKITGSGCSITYHKPQYAGSTEE